MTYSGEDPWTRGWLAIGVGSGSIASAGPAPSASRDAFAFSIDTGYRINRQWGLGLEYGVLAPNGGCGGHHCTPADPDFAPDFSHWFLLAEQRPGDGGLRVRAGVGVSSMCYRYYRARDSGWHRFWQALIFDDDQDEGSISWHCKSLHALGAAASIGYQWALPDSLSSVGLQLRGEAANFAESSTAGTPAFHHRAVMLLVQFDIN
ncbi:MAG: hypothetical protein WDO12_07905 [Pseudomonadota bacterium]